MTLCRCGCGLEIPQNGTGRPRQWLNESHRKRGENGSGVTEPIIGDGPLVAAVRRAIDVSRDEFDVVQDAQAEQALLLASIIEGKGPSSVPASRELRAVLDALAFRLDQEQETFMRAVRTPIVYGADDE
jgi:hypothetical protein